MQSLDEAMSEILSIPIGHTSRHPRHSSHLVGSRVMVRRESLLKMPIGASGQRYRHQNLEKSSTRAIVERRVVMWT